jgi:hypothetical protein
MPGAFHEWHVWLSLRVGQGEPFQEQSLRICHTLREAQAAARIWCQG